MGNACFASSRAAQYKRGLNESDLWQLTGSACLNQASDHYCRWVVDAWRMYAKVRSACPAIRGIENSSCGERRRPVATDDQYSRVPRSGLRLCAGISIERRKQTNFR